MDAGGISAFLKLMPGFGAGGSQEARAEAELPLTLRTLGMLLEMGVPFGQALSISMGEGEASGLLFSEAIAEIRQGAGVPKALARLAERSNSKVIKKAAAQMISAYEHGGGGREMMQIADDLLSLQRYRMRDFASKSALFGLLFVISATVVPTFFLVFSTAGGFALGIEISAVLFLACFLLVFPAVNLAILMAAESQMPPAAFERKGVSDFPLAFFCFAFLLGLIMALETDLVLRAGALVAACAGSGWFFLNSYREEGRLEKIESAVPDALLGASGLPKSYGIERIFRRMSEAGNALSPEAGKTASQLEAGLGVEKALEDLWARNGSPVLRRMSRLMLNAQLAGANVSEKMHEMAGDLLRFAEIRRERENALSMQKYTLLMGAAVVPVILSVSLSLGSQVAGLVGQQAGEAAGVAPGAISGYVILYSAVSAFYVSRAEGRGSALYIYFAGMALAGLAGIYIISSQLWYV